MDPEVSHIPEPGKGTKIIASSDDHPILREKEVLRLLAQGHSTRSCRYPVYQHNVRSLGLDEFLTNR
jgi:hypothetical protein